MSKNKNINLCGAILTLLALIMLLLSGCASARREVFEWKWELDTFHLEAKATAGITIPPGSETIVLNRNKGTYSYWGYDHQAGKVVGRKKDFRLTDEQLKDLIRTIDDEGWDSLANNYYIHEVFNGPFRSLTFVGKFRSLTIDYKGQKKTVNASHLMVPQLDRILYKLNSLTPEALDISEYTVVSTGHEKYIPGVPPLSEIEKGYLSEEAFDTKGFHLIGISGSRDPWGPVYKIEIYENKGTYYYRKAACDLKWDKKQEFHLSDEQLKDFIKTLYDEWWDSFWECWYHSDLPHGTFRMLSINLHGFEKTVVADNLIMPPLDAIILKLNSLSPEGCDLIYNEITDEKIRRKYIELKE